MRDAYRRLQPRRLRRRPKPVVPPRPKGKFDPELRPRVLGRFAHVSGSCVSASQCALSGRWTELFTAVCACRRMILSAAGWPELYRFLDAGNTEAGRALSEPASKKRRCTKSRDAGQRLGGERYGDFSLVSLASKWSGGGASLRRRAGHAWMRERAREREKRLRRRLKGIDGRRAIDRRGPGREGSHRREASAKGRESGGAQKGSGS
jgi:hypothetical protein